MHLSQGTQTCMVFTLAFPEAFFQASLHQLQTCGFLQTICQWPFDLHSAPSGTLLLSSPFSPGHAFWLEKQNITISLLVQVCYEIAFNFIQSNNYSKTSHTINLTKALTDE